MDKKNTQKNRVMISSILRKITIIVVLAYFAITVGTYSGNLLTRVDYKMVENIDAGFFKGLVNSTWPLIDTVYNSGKIKASISYEIDKLISDIFSFSLNKPLTVLNANSAIFHNYYAKSYRDDSPGNIAQNPGEAPFIDPAYPDPNLIINPNEPPGQTGTPETEHEPEIHEEDPGETDPDASSPDYGKIIVRNETKVKVDIEALIKEPLKLKFDQKNPQVLIYHTHNEEGYLKTITDLKNSSYLSTTDDERYSVLGVGEELKKSLEKLGIGVLHNGTDHRYPKNSDRYANSNKTVTSILKAYPSLKILLDIHRDGLPTGKGKLRAVTNVAGKNVAKMMFVVTNGSYGYSHPNWKENMKLALRLQQKLIDQNPGLVKPIYLVGYRYNEQLSPGSLVVEIGGDGNTAEEAAESAKYLAKALSEVMSGK